MTMEASTQVNIKILEKEYQISCPISERAALLSSAELLNTRMREIRDSGKVVGTERIALMAALNIAHELVSKKPKGPDLAPLKQKVEDMSASIDQVLNEQEKLF